MISWLRSWFSPSLATPAPHRPVRRVLELEALESRIAPAGVLAVGSGGYVELFHDPNNYGIPSGVPYATLAGGEHAAIGHFTSASTLQVAVAHGAGSSIVKIYQLDANENPNGQVEIFTAFSGHFGVNLARFHSNGATFDSLIVAASTGGRPSVNVYNDGTALNGATPNDKLLGNSKIDSFLAFKASFTGGVQMAASRNLAAAGGDFLVMAPGHGRSSCVILNDTSGNLLLSDNLATAEKLDPFGKGWAGGISVAVGDVGSPSTNPELIFGMGPGGPPRVSIFSDTNLNGVYGDDGGAASSFLAYGAGYRGGVRVAYSRLSSANVGQSGEVVVAAGGGHLPVEVFKSKTNIGEIKAGDAPLATFFPFGFTYTKGEFVAFGGNGT
jgi:hypothetical protein